MNIIKYNLYYLLRQVYYHAGSPDVIGIINIINDVTVIICRLNIRCFRFNSSFFVVVRSCPLFVYYSSAVCKIAITITAAVQYCGCLSAITIRLVLLLLLGYYCGCFSVSE